MNKKTSLKNRYNLIDILRGTAVICMIIYHTLWDIVYMFGVDIPLFRTTSAHIFQQYILWSFVIISGFCLNLCKHPFKRGIITLGLSIAMTLATMIVIPEATIIFGVLTFLGAAMLITGALRKPLSRIKYYIGLPLSALLFFITYNTSEGNLGFGGLIICDLPEALYSGYFSAFFGFPNESFTSADYVPLFPWLFLYFAGFFIFDLLKSNNLMKHLSTFRIPPIEWLGRHALIIYIIHQPVIFVVLYIIFRFI